MGVGMKGFIVMEWETDMELSITEMEESMRENGKTI